jgi:hypothetical protein
MTSAARKVWDRRRDWGIDRRAQKTETFTGIDGIDAQDHAVQESMGPIVDRTHEHLVRTDLAVISARRALLGAIRSVERGETPLGVGRSYYRLRAIEKILEPEIQWREALAAEFSVAALDSEPSGI